MIIDCHAHLCDESFDKDLPAVLARATKAGISKIISVSETLTDVQKNLQLAEKYPMILTAVGLFPNIFNSDQLDAIINVIKTQTDKLAAIGEVGLDFWIAKTDEEKAKQREIFRQFINLSNETGLPLNIHSRSAGRHVIEMLIDHNAQKVQLHAFDGKASTAKPAVEAGYYFSIPPSIVRSRQKQKLVKNLPLDCLLLETDSPVLGANPKQRNEPANITYSIKAIAEIKNISEQEVIEVTARNAKALYAIKL